jgi:hypothetical protein
MDRAAEMIASHWFCSSIALPPERYACDNMILLPASLEPEAQAIVNAVEEINGMAASVRDASGAVRLAYDQCAPTQVSASYLECGADKRSN